jgi:hypothetical protein
MDIKDTTGKHEKDTNGKAWTGLNWVSKGTSGGLERTQ